MTEPTQRDSHEKDIKRKDLSSVYNKDHNHDLHHPIS